MINPKKKIIIFNFSILLSMTLPVSIEFTNNNLALKNNLNMDKPYYTSNENKVLNNNLKINTLPYIQNKDETFELKLPNPQDKVLCDTLMYNN